MDRIVRRLTPRVVCLLVGLGAALLLAQTTGKHSVMQEDIGVYNAALSSPGTLSSATLTQALSDVASKCGTKCAVFLTQGSWSLTTNHTIAQPLVVPYGTTVTIANGMTLTLQACPKIDRQGWLAPGTTGRVNVTASGCRVDVHKFATGGNGTSAAPWTGWEQMLSTTACSPACTWDNLTHWYFEKGVFSATHPIVLPNGYGGAAFIDGAGRRTTEIRFTPSAANQTFLTIGQNTGTDTGEAFEGHIRRLYITTADTTYVKTGLWLIDVDDFSVDEVDVVNFGDTTCNSRAVYIQGRDNSVYKNSNWIADIPLQIGGSPNSTTTRNNFDRNALRDLGLFVTTNCHTYGILIDGGAFLTRNKFSNINVSQGSYGIMWRATSNYFHETNEWDHISFERPMALAVGSTSWDGSTVTSDTSLAKNWGWMFYHVNNTGSAYTQWVTLRHFTSAGAANGIYLRAVRNVRVEQYNFLSQTTPAAPIALDLQGGPPMDVYPLTCTNCWAQDATVLNLNTVTPHFVSAQGWFGKNGAFQGYTQIVFDNWVVAVPAEGPVAWQPRLSGQGTAGSHTYSVRNGVYVWQVTPHVVEADVHLTISTIDSAMAGSLSIGCTPSGTGCPLPWQSRLDDDYVALCPVLYNDKVTLTTGYTGLIGRVNQPSGGNSIVLYQYGPTQVPLILQATQVASGLELTLHCTIITN